MNKKYLVVGAVVLVLLGVGLWFTQKQKPHVQKSIPQDTPNALSQFTKEHFGFGVDMTPKEYTDWNIQCDASLLPSNSTLPGRIVCQNGNPTIRLFIGWAVASTSKLMYARDIGNQILALNNIKEGYTYCKAAPLATWYAQGTATVSDCTLTAGKKAFTYSILFFDATSDNYYNAISAVGIRGDVATSSTHTTIINFSKRIRTNTTSNPVSASWVNIAYAQDSGGEGGAGCSAGSSGTGSSGTGCGTGGTEGGGGNPPETQPVCTNGATNYPDCKEGSIYADPVPCELSRPDGTCSTLLSWSAIPPLYSELGYTGNLPAALFIRETGQWIMDANQGSYSAPWVQQRPLTIDLHERKDINSGILASVVVWGRYWNTYCTGSGNIDPNNDWKWWQYADTPNGREFRQAPVGVVGDGLCQPPTTPTPTTPTPTPTPVSCTPGSGQIVVNNVCQCPSGLVLSNGVCGCPPGQTMVGGVCKLSCAADLQTWTVSNATCAGTAMNANDSQTVTVNSSNGNQGRADYICNNGAFNLTGSPTCQQVCSSGQIFVNGVCVNQVWTTYCTGGSDLNGNNWQWWQYDNAVPRNYQKAPAGVTGTGTCAPSTPETWTTYCTGGSDANGNFWQWWQYNNAQPPAYRKAPDGVTGTGSCSPIGCSKELIVCPDGVTSQHREPPTCAFVPQCPSTGGCTPVWNGCSGVWYQASGDSGPKCYSICPSGTRQTRITGPNDALYCGADYNTCELNPPVVGSYPSSYAVIAASPYRISQGNSTKILYGTNSGTDGTCTLYENPTASWSGRPQASDGVEVARQQYFADSFSHQIYLTSGSYYFNTGAIQPPKTYRVVCTDSYYATYSGYSGPFLYTSKDVTVQPYVPKLADLTAGVVSPTVVRPSESVTLTAPIQNIGTAGVCPNSNSSSMGYGIRWPAAPMSNTTWNVGDWFDYMLSEPQTGTKEINGDVLPREYAKVAVYQAGQSSLLSGMGSLWFRINGQWLPSYDYDHPAAFDGNTGIVWWMSPAWYASGGPDSVTLGEAVLPDIGLPRPTSCVNGPGVDFNNVFQVADSVSTNGTASGVQDLGVTTIHGLSAQDNSVASLSTTFAQAGTKYVRVCAGKNSGADPVTYQESNTNNNCGSWTKITIGNATGPDKPVIGVHDSISAAEDCSVTRGWTCDPDSSDLAVTVQLYKDTPPENGGTPVWVGYANATREQAVADLCGGVATHGIYVPTPSVFKDGTDHKQYVYAKDNETGALVPLYSTPHTLNCSAQCPAGQTMVNNVCKCSNGAVNPPLCTVNGGGQCINGAINPDTCNQCAGGVPPVNGICPSTSSTPTADLVVKTPDFPDGTHSLLNADPLQSRTWAWTSTGGTTGYGVSDTSNCDDSTQNATNVDWLTAAVNAGAGTQLQGSKATPTGVGRSGCHVIRTYYVKNAAGVASPVARAEIQFKSLGTGVCTPYSASQPLDANPAGCSSGTAINVGAAGSNWTWVCHGGSVDSGTCTAPMKQSVTITSTRSQVPPDTAFNLQITTVNTQANQCVISDSNGGSAHLSNPVTGSITYGVPTGITQRTVYTVTCPGAGGTTLTGRYIMNLIPNEVEQ